jgi:aldehyde reductase
MIYADTDYADTWKALQKSVKDGKVRSIGLSNFNSKQIQRVMDMGGDVKVSMLQVGVIRNK